LASGTASPVGVDDAAGHVGGAGGMCLVLTPLLFLRA
jgi:hypothetical protein